MQTNTINDLALVTPKFYADVFNVNIKTARIWFKDDCEQVNRKRLTIAHFNLIYKGLDVLSVPTLAAQLTPKKATKTPVESIKKPVRKKAP